MPGVDASGEASGEEGGEACGRGGEGPFEELVTNARGSRHGSIGGGREGGRDLGEGDGGKGARGKREGVGGEGRIDRRGFRGKKPVVEGGRHGGGIRGKAVRALEGRDNSGAAACHRLPESQ
jgi:hypothetical protein